MLFKEIVFGPIHSRRLGISLGINLLPVKSKVCNFNCIYCECGWNPSIVEKNFNKSCDVKIALEKKLIEMQKNSICPDSITFSGNGEPTMHPNFLEIINNTIELRNKYAPTAKVSVLSNATMLDNPEIIYALQLVDNPILKLDSGINKTAVLINKPQFNYSLEKTVENMQALKNKMILQTMFLRGNYNGKKIDNTNQTEITAWINIIRKIYPREIMIYTIDRIPPASNLQKISFDELENIANIARSFGYKLLVAK